MKTRCLPSLCIGCIAAAPGSYRCMVASAAAATCKAQSASYCFHLCPQNSMQKTEADLQTVTNRMRCQEKILDIYAALVYLRQSGRAQVWKK